jgi:hypothetical protein
MKKSLLVAGLIFMSFALFAQDVTGTWNGLLVVPNGQLHVDFHITAAEKGYTATMDSPDQGAFGIPVATVSYEEQEVRITMPEIDLVYTGKLNEKNPDLIDGTLQQMGQTFEMDLKRKKEK